VVKLFSDAPYNTHEVCLAIDRSIAEGGKAGDFTAGTGFRVAIMIRFGPESMWSSSKPARWNWPSTFEVKTKEP